MKVVLTLELSGSHLILLLSTISTPLSCHLQHLNRGLLRFNSLGSNLLMKKKAPRTSHLFRNHSILPKIQNRKYRCQRIKEQRKTFKSYWALLTILELIHRLRLIRHLVDQRASSKPSTWIGEGLLLKLVINLEQTILRRFNYL